MKTTRHSILAKGILVLLSLLVLIFAFTYTWFVPGDIPATASGLSITVNNPSTDFEYAIGFSNSQTGGLYKHTAFTNTVDTDLDLEQLYEESDAVSKLQPYNLLLDYNPIDITGDGVNLVRPAMKYGNWTINTASRNYSVAEENVQYITFDLIFRTTVENTKIRLDSDSVALGNCETHSGDGSLRDSSVANFNANKDNKYGVFSRDAIVGAVRVAFLGYTDHSETADQIVSNKLTDYQSLPLLLWIPRPDIYLNNNPTNAGTTREKETSGWELTPNVASGTTFNLRSEAQNKADYSTYVHQYYNVFGVAPSATPAIVSYPEAVASVLNTSAPDGTDKVTFGRTQDLITLTHINDTNSDDVPDDGKYYGKVRVRIWIEGTDSEARRALTGGKFRIKFHITGGQ